MKLCSTILSVITVLMLAYPANAEAIQKTLQGQDVSLKIHRMDTRRNSDEKYNIQAAQTAKPMIENYKNPRTVPTQKVR
jgi:hypothetical protein